MGNLGTLGSVPVIDLRSYGGWREAVHGKNFLDFCRVKIFPDRCSIAHWPQKNLCWEDIISPLLHCNKSQHDQRHKEFYLLTLLFMLNLSSKSWAWYPKVCALRSHMSEFISSSL